MKKCKACTEPAVVRLTMVITYGRVVPTGEPITYRLRGSYCAEHAALAQRADEIKVVRSHVLA